MSHVVFRPKFLLQRAATVRSISGTNKPRQRYAGLSSAAAGSDTSQHFQLSPRLDGLDKPTVWHEFSPLSVEYKSINLGQGFPDWDPPPFVVQAMVESTDPSFGRHANQYARSAAHMPLAQVLAEEYSSKLGREGEGGIDPATEVATTVGCTQGLYCALQGLVRDGDEVVILEPAFDVYTSQILLAGGKPKFVPLRSRSVTPSGQDDGLPPSLPSSNDAFYLDFDELEASIGPQTRVMILNTPHNPTGKMFSIGEMEAIADIVRRNPQLTVITDEVYEHVVFDQASSPHISFGSLPDMYNQTLTLSSSGKTFSCTGWKVGWAVGPPHLVRAVTSMQQWIQFAVATPNQDAIALSLVRAREGFEGHETFYSYLASEYLRKRDILVDALQVAGLTPIVPNGGFFIMADTSNIAFPDRYLEEVTPAMPTDPMPRDWAMSRWMTKEVGVTAIPPSAFYEKESVGLASNLLRFAFCKGDNTILEARARFADYFRRGVDAA